MDGQESTQEAGQNSGFNRILLIVLAVLYVSTLAIFIYAEWAADPASQPWWMMALNALILSIPLVLLYGSIYVLAIAWRVHSRGGQVSPRLGKIIHWAPRVASILIIFFTSLFSLDVFGTGEPPLQVLLAFLAHNIPTICMIVLLIFAWKRPVVGFAAFLVTGVLFAMLFVRDMYALQNLLLFVFPLLLIAFLFYADWKWLAEPPSSPNDAAAAP
jgi:hypothetical protein